MIFDTRAAKALLDRLEPATLPGEDIDLCAMALFYRREQRFIGVHDDATNERVLSDVWVDPLTDECVSTHPYAFSASLDRCTELAERALPGRNRTVGKGRLSSGEPLFGAQILEGESAIGQHESCHSEALALLGAILIAAVEVAERGPAAPEPAAPAREVIIHETTAIKVWADIDVGIAPVVEHLNTIAGVRTHASCQGSLGEGGAAPYRAYVVASWPPEALEQLRRDFDVVPHGENWGDIHPRGKAEEIA